MKQFIVSGGDFFKTEGVLSRIELNENTGELKLLSEKWFSHPISNLGVEGKGFTGLCIDGDTAWTCFSNLIVAIDLDSYSIIDSWADSEFIDLHQIEFHDNQMLLANTGNESIDILNLSKRSINRIDLLGNDIRQKRPKFEQNQDTKPHLHHVSSVTYNSNGDIIAGIVRQSRILNLTDWKWLGPRMRGPVHDVSCDDDGSTWCTSVPGYVYRFSADGSQKVWDLSEYQNPVGWTRGLAVTQKGMLVGTTAIRDSNYDYFSSFTVDRVGDVEASVSWIPFDEKEQATILYLPNGFSRKIFTIVSVQE
jgi:hypothetical protein